MPNLELLDVVAVLHDLPEHGLSRGQVGTVVDVHSPSAVEVEFIDNAGQTYALEALSVEDLMQLHHDPLQHAA